MTKTTTTVDTRTVRKQLSEILHCVRYGNERVIVTHHRKPYAVFVSPEDLALLEKALAAQAKAAESPQTGAEMALAIQRDFEFPGDK